MTEEEAKTKWCPHVRAQKNGDGSDNASNRLTSISNPSWARCIGSDCMAWRWGGLAHGSHTVTARILWNPETGSTETIDEYPSKWGYCGLAGRP